MGAALDNNGYPEWICCWTPSTATVFHPDQYWCSSEPKMETACPAVGHSRFCANVSWPNTRCESRNETPPSLETFVLHDDSHFYDHNTGLSCMVARAELCLVNKTSSLQRLYKTLEDLALANGKRLRPNWDEYFMQLASLAARRSNCMKRRVGCVLVREKRVISTGYNGTPRNSRNCNEGGCEC